MKTVSIKKKKYSRKFKKNSIKKKKMNRKKTNKHKGSGIQLTECPRKNCKSEILRLFTFAKDKFPDCITHIDGWEKVIQSRGICSFNNNKEGEAISDRKKMEKIINSNIKTCCQRSGTEQCLDNTKTTVNTVSCAFTNQESSTEMCDNRTVTIDWQKDNKLENYLKGIIEDKNIN